MVRALEVGIRVPFLPELVADRIQEKDGSVGEFRAVAEHEACRIRIVIAVGLAGDVRVRGIAETDLHGAARCISEIERRICVPADGALAAEAREAPAGQLAGLEEARRRGTVELRAEVAAQPERAPPDIVVGDIELAARGQAGGGLRPEAAAVEPDIRFDGGIVPRGFAFDDECAIPRLVTNSGAIRPMLTDDDIGYDPIRFER